MTFRIATWNINSLRHRRETVARFLREAGPDVLCLQETKSPVELLPLRRPDRTRPGRLAAHVDEVGALGDLREPTRDGGVPGEVEAAVGERVRVTLTTPMTRHRRGVGSPSTCERGRPAVTACRA